VLARSGSNRKHLYGGRKLGRSSRQSCSLWLRASRDDLVQFGQLTDLGSLSIAPNFHRRRQEPLGVFACLERPSRRGSPQRYPLCDQSWRPPRPPFARMRRVRSKLAASRRSPASNGRNEAAIRPRCDCQPVQGRSTRRQLATGLGSCRRFLRSTLGASSGDIDRGAITADEPRRP
jgi:hypothetical protein